MSKTLKKILVISSICIFCILAYFLIFGIQTNEIRTYKVDASNNFKGVYKGTLTLTDKQLKEKTGIKTNKIYLDLKYDNSNANILFALEKYKIDNVEIDKEKVVLSTNTNITYFPLDPKEKLEDIFEITEIYFDGILSKTDNIKTTARLKGGRFDIDKELDAKRQIIFVSKNYIGTGYFKCLDIKVNFDFNFENIKF